MTSVKPSTYLDHNATTAIRPGVISAVASVMAQTGNASSVHGAGRAARSIVEKAREQVAALVGVTSPQVVFTSGATESNNAVFNAFKGQRILVSAIEHPSVLESANGAEEIPVTQDGIVDIKAFEALLDKANAPALISIMLVNNETGVIQPIADLARLAKSKHPGIYIHCDAVQAAGRIPVNFQALQLDYMSLSAHKMGGPQGVGALISAPGAKPAKLLHGGGQEKRQRAGTENVAGIAGFGVAAEIAQKNIAAYEKLSALRDKLEKSLKSLESTLIVLGEKSPRVANTSCVSLPGVSAQTLLMSLDLEGIAVSSGSACSSGTIKPSRVACAMGLDSAAQSGVIRISLGWNSAPEDIDAFLAAWEKTAPRLKKSK